jgi:hypothetical protein
MDYNLEVCILYRIINGFRILYTFNRACQRLLVERLEEELIYIIFPILQEKVS